MSLTLSDIKSMDDTTLRSAVTDSTTAVRLRNEARDAARQVLDRARGNDLAGDDASKFDELATIAERLTELVTELQAAEARHDGMLALIRGAEGVGGLGEVAVVGGAGVDGVHASTRAPATTPRDVAMRGLDQAIRDKRTTERGAEVIESVMTTGPVASQSWAQRWALRAGSPAYERAFGKLLTGERGHLLWTTDEADAYRHVQALQAERAMSTADTAGGYMIPAHLDPAVILTGQGSTNPLRQIARVVQTTGDTWNGVTSAGVTAEWVAEGAEFADASPSIAQPSIQVHKADAFVPFSFEVEGDAVSFLGELQKLLADAAEQLTATAYTTGTGVGQPKGIVTALAAAAGSKVAPGVAETIAASDVYRLQNALPPRFQTNATWTANLAVLNLLRQFETANGSLLFPGLQSNPPSLLGRTVHENSNQGGLPNPAATADNYPLLYGDFSQFVIVDRIGATLEHIPHLFGANGRPTGQRGALLWFRTGSNVTSTNAFRTLSVPTTA